ncbi:hypothetical protein AGMMS49940_24330 [Spirochaetia bacterium]|nr:hypothetical protein AGMMS49940_24330 [Spirochaetia bacterium]
MKRMLCVLALFGVLFDAYAQTYYTGDGGKGIRIAVVPPEGKGLDANETWMPALVQGMLITNLTRYSAMTVIDRRNMEEIDTIPAEVTGYYGKAANAPYILTGVILKTGNTYVLQLAVVHAETGERRASYRSMSTTAAHFENGDTVNDAVPALLSQLWVTLTDAGKAALETSGKSAKSQTALAKGIIAQRNGKALEALSWYIQAETLPFCPVKGADFAAGSALFLGQSSPQAAALPVATKPVCTVLTTLVIVSTQD